MLYSDWTCAVPGSGEQDKRRVLKVKERKWDVDEIEKGGKAFWVRRILLNWHWGATLNWHWGATVVGSNPAMHLFFLSTDDFAKRWRRPQILQFCEDDRLVRRMHVLSRPRLLPYTSVVPAKLQDLRPSPSFTKSSIQWCFKTGDGTRYKYGQKNSVMTLCWPCKTCRHLFFFFFKKKVKSRHSPATILGAVYGHRGEDGHYGSHDAWHTMQVMHTACIVEEQLLLEVRLHVLVPEHTETRRNHADQNGCPGLEQEVGWVADSNTASQGGILNVYLEESNDFDYHKNAI